jgi:hypothetical protein
MTEQETVAWLERVASMPDDELQALLDKTEAWTASQPPMIESFDPADSEDE